MRRSPSSAILPLPALVKCGPYFVLGSLTPISSLPCSFSLFPLSHSCSLSLSLACTFSVSQSHSRSLSLSFSSTDRAAKGARLRLRAEQTAFSFPSPASRRVLSCSVQERGIQTLTSGLLHFLNLGERSDEGERRGGEKRREGGWQEHERSIPPTGQTWSYHSVTLSALKCRKSLFHHSYMMLF